MKSIIYVGIDVHKDTYSLCSFEMQKDVFFLPAYGKSINCKRGIISE
ncbi:MAG: hypothetical protein IKQ13_00735 [Treponema sp.]|nr:hypothetical protein [Treponema sp.]